MKLCDRGYRQHRDETGVEIVLNRGYSNWEWKLLQFQVFSSAINPVAVGAARRGIGIGRVVGRGYRMELAVGGVVGGVVVGIDIGVDGDIGWGGGCSGGNLGETLVPLLLFRRIVDVDVGNVVDVDTDSDGCTG